jgi:hypothetical protein
VAYSANTGDANNPRMIFVRILSSLAANALPGTEGAVGVSWSPDSSQIAFGTASALKRVSLAGGPPQIICNRQVNQVAWNRDDVILFSPGGNQPLFGGGKPLFKVATSGGEPQPVTRLDQSRQEVQDFFPQFLPDRRHFIYLGFTSKPETTASYVGSLEIRWSWWIRWQRQARFRQVGASTRSRKAVRLPIFRDLTLLGGN